MSLKGLWEPFAPADASSPAPPSVISDDHQSRMLLKTSPSANSAVDSRTVLEYQCMHNYKSSISKAEVLDLLAKESALAASYSDGSAQKYHMLDDGKLHLECSLLSSRSASLTPLSRTTAGRMCALTCVSDGIGETMLDTDSTDKTPPPRPRYLFRKQMDILCAALSPDGLYLAAGSQGTLLLFDCASANLVATFEETHKEAVSQVTWAPGHPATLISSSDDGLVTVFDFKDGVDEDDSWKAALNLEGAVARMGFYGSDGEKLWMVSQTAGLHLWSWHAACSEDVPGGEGTLADFHDARPELAAGCVEARQTGAAGREPPATYDFLIACHFEQSRHELILAAGCNDGGCALFGVSEPSATSAASLGPVVAWMTGSHTDAIRGIVWLPNGLIATGGDDGQICIWKASSEANEAKRKKRRIDCK